MARPFSELREELERKRNQMTIEQMEAQAVRLFGNGKLSENVTSHQWSMTAEICRRLDDMGCSCRRDVAKIEFDVKLEKKSIFRRFLDIFVWQRGHDV
jgi:hypothetical protein